ncbi:hypothetical protein [Synechococcus sp. CBW1108]|uniref:hypothetical protein n=1 Tax=Synechococcus sp. CBW1108 TaxID=1353147 RepID=UPI0018CD8307|nr:hypothetical protein [Synechococcus sp. CBW1108]QPN71505.1 hypothetical protein H8F27_08175 [Synechococcus sp. CBW1108]
MALSSDLIATARQLANVHQRRPRQADLRRSISTAATQKSAAWMRVHRNLNHLTAKKACSRPELQGCSQGLAQFLAAFPRLQELRHQADYDPAARFKQGEALSAADDAERGLAGLQAAPRDEQLDFITLALGMTRS